MKNTRQNNLEQLKPSLGKCIGIQADIDKLAKALSESTAEMQALPPDADILNDEVQLRIAKLRTVVENAPARIESRKRALAAEAKSLVALNNRFISTVLKPRFLDVHKRALARFEQSLPGNTFSPEAIPQVFESSLAGRELGAIRTCVLVRSFDPMQAIRIAQESSEAVSALDAFEATHLV